jgi:antitoxin (DNA-binding transcriptional repressor) of toxin-antitoxin stability system
MSDIVLSVTKAARSFAEIVICAHYRSETFLLLKHGVPFARIVPVGNPICRASDLAKALLRVNLSRAEARAWQRDLKTARKKLKPPVDR